MDDASPGVTDTQWSKWSTECADYAQRFDENGGLTRSWNKGLRMARYLGATYAICGNSDTIFSPGFDTGLLEALEKAHLVGPVSNAPGWGCKRQNIENYCANYELTDNRAAINDTAAALRDQPVRLQLPRREIISNADGESVTVNYPETLNGFTLCARTDDWWSGAYDSSQVFNPGYPMEGSEAELQIRWAHLDRIAAIAPRSFVFHYRAITRGDDHLCAGAFRRD